MAINLLTKNKTKANMTLPTITIKYTRDRFIITDEYGNAKVCDERDELANIVDTWAAAMQPNDIDALAHMMGGPIADVDELIDSLTL